MFYKVSLYVALVIFFAGMVYRISAWFRFSFGAEGEGISFSRRVSASIRGVVLTVFSPKIVILIRVLLLDIVLQRRLLRESHVRWFAHMGIFVGFFLLLFGHALDDVITAKLFADYSPRVNPFLLLRDICFALVLIGVIIAFCRRRVRNNRRLFQGWMDYPVLFIIGIVVLSGLFLEEVKIVSYSSYLRMAEEYGDLADERESRALEAYWVNNFGIASPHIKGPIEKDVLAEGKELHEISCAACHSRPQWAFVGYAVAKGVGPIALELDAAGVPTFLWYLHWLVCFAGLAYLPFSKMFHIFATPLSLLANSVMSRGSSDVANLATKRVMELDACANCEICNSRCAVAACIDHFADSKVVPSQKIASLKSLIAGKNVGRQQIMEIQDSLFLCSSCDRCNAICPAGINLREMWFDVREFLLQKGYPELLALTPLSFHRGLRSDELEPEDYQKPLNVARRAIAEACNAFNLQGPIIHLSEMRGLLPERLRLSRQGSTFPNCYTCTTCSSVCPVFNHFDDPLQRLGLAPHQIIYAAKMGLSDLIFSCEMLWCCLGCYQCEESCPQGVHVTEVFYELKSMAIRYVQEKTSAVLNGKSS